MSIRFFILAIAKKDSVYELTYESLAQEGVGSALIKDILEESRKNNEKNGVTGCLVYYNHKFIQILEGDKEAVQLTYEKIKKDDRHHQIRLIAENPIENRTFPKWGMAYFPLDEQDLSKNELEQFRRNLRLLADLSDPVSVSSILFWKKVRMLVGEPPDPSI